MCTKRPPITVSLTFDPEEMARRGRIGARRRIALHDDPHELTEAARSAFLGRFRTEEERAAYFRDLGRKSGEARRARRVAEVGGHDRAA